ncbi:MAG: two-component system, OmpR family, sensor kinase [Chloroflexota bacterium]|jgi:signal transduction histidine kinase|nr:two-component system, OmpR family, sensor kinase [Chloroflexota bacterium]
MQLFNAFLRTYRVRLVLAFALVVAVALGLVLATLPRLLDGYFQDQERQSLQTRADSVAVLVQEQLAIYQTLGTDSPRPILVPTVPLSPSDSMVQALGDAAGGYLADLTRRIALADLTFSIAPSRAEPLPVYVLTIPLDPAVGAPGQQREPISASQTIEIRDSWWSQTGLGAPMRLVTVTLSDPYTNRAQTTQTIASVLLAAASLALIVAIVAAVLLAQRLTDPIRRLTQASRSLAGGQLDSRVVVAPSESPEVAELAGAFNDMADRLQQSIQIISQDRDRSREFLADVSHELRTPIAALRTFNELLRDGASADPQTRDEFLEQSARQIERLDWLSTNLLELSKLDSGLVALDLRPDDLRVAVENAVEQAQPVASRKGVELVTKVPLVEVRQQHDPTRIGQVLSNLVGNAIKFTPPGGRVEVALEDAPEGAELSVTDNGAGITADELPHVFERFYRGTSSEAERGAGSGLGLSIAKSIVDMHGGRISIQSAPGSGTQIVVSLPRDMSISSPGEARG